MSLTQIEVLMSKKLHTVMVLAHLVSLESEFLSLTPVILKVFIKHISSVLNVLLHDNGSSRK